MTCDTASHLSHYDRCLQTHRRPKEYTRRARYTQLSNRKIEWTKIKHQVFLWRTGGSVLNRVRLNGPEQTSSALIQMYPTLTWFFNHFSFLSFPVSHYSCY